MGYAKFKRFVFLGDSNADTGNLLRLTNNTYPDPRLYHQGRYCNGSIWADQLVAQLGIPSFNDAYGRATIDSELADSTITVDGAEIQIPALAIQVERLQDLGAEDLVFVQVGSNDLNALIDGSVTRVVGDTYTMPQLAGRLLQVVEAICEGARHVVVMNVRPREDYPAVLQRNDTEIREKSRRDTAEFNAAVAEGISELNERLGETHTLTVFDTYGFQKRISGDCAAYGIDPDVQTPCISVSSEDGSAILTNPETKLFYDTAHLAKRPQALLKDAMLEHITLHHIQ
ncbi:hypothetical protein FBU59_000056 [Linderina macrospora]|uniref:Uncharacterized protein n=1 Tax=Linderina macrospora TaxID=4868 RepID=A0ACC1JI11_9FUNG|nr:hypothetical protein FBU59_000056 [Linderina macrospora]